MDIKTFLMLERRRLMRNIEKIDDQLKELPPGSIQFERNGRYWKWRQSFPNTDQPSVCLPKSNLPLAEALSYKKFLSEQKDGLTAQINLIDRFLFDHGDTVRYPDNLKERCPDYRKLLAPFFSERDTFFQRWMDTPAESSAIHPENLIFPTKSGILVRSKSEVMIADALFDHGLPFRYEMSLDLGAMTIHPDFALPFGSPNNLTLWEHLGRMEVGDYARANLTKILSLIEAGFVPGKNLILTYETRDVPLNINLVELLIGFYFL